MREIIETLNLLEPLTHIVQCSIGVGGFRTIAAFDSKRVAEGYEADCKTANPQFIYRVCPIEKD